VRKAETINEENNVDICDGERKKSSEMMRWEMMR
jgi:hypothetical protein